MHLQILPSKGKRMLAVSSLSFSGVPPASRSGNEKQNIVTGRKRQIFRDSGIRSQIIWYTCICKIILMEITLFKKCHVCGSILPSKGDTGAFSAQSDQDLPINSDGLSSRVAILHFSCCFLPIRRLPKFNDVSFVLFRVKCSGNFRL